MHEPLKKGRRDTLIFIYKGIQCGDHRVWYSSPVTAGKKYKDCVPYVGSRPSTLLVAPECYFTTHNTHCRSTWCASQLQW
eukprot:scaffold173736_cov23-Prasinocladus_malaysianus.AAC.1